MPCAHAVFGDEDLRILGRRWQLLPHDSLHRRIVVGPLRYVALTGRNNDPWTKHHPGIPDEPLRERGDEAVSVRIARLDHPPPAAQTQDQG